MSKKIKLSSWFVFCFTAISLFLLMISLVSLIQFGNTSLVPTSVSKLILVNGSLVNFNAYVNHQSFKIPFLSSLVSTKWTSSSITTIASNSTTNIEGPPRKELTSPNQGPLRIYMYDLPPEFHFGLLGWNAKQNETWPDIDGSNRIPSYAGGLNLQHSIEYWLTLDLLASNNPKVVRPCNAVRVENSSEADVIFIPFFSSLSYNRFSKVHGKEKLSLNKKLQNKLVQFLVNRKEWKRHNGKDHLIIAHHPNSMSYARKKLASAMFILADFGRYPVEIANLRKDVIAPYKHLVRTIPSSNSPQFNERPTLAYFQGAIYRKAGGVIRQELYYLLKDEKDVHFAFGTIQGNGVRMASQGMASSKFCLNIAGDTPSSNRLFDAIVSHCVPVIISDDIELPFEDVIDFSEFCVFVHEYDAVKKGYLINLLRGIEKDAWTKMWERLKEIAHHFEYHYPALPDDAVDMIWKDVLYRKFSIRNDLNRKNRYQRSANFVNGN